MLHSVPNICRKVKQTLPLSAPPPHPRFLLLDTSLFLIHAWAYCFLNDGRFNQERKQFINRNEAACVGLTAPTWFHTVEKSGHLSAANLLHRDIQTHSPINPPDLPIRPLPPPDYIHLYVRHHSPPPSYWRGQTERD